MAPGSQFGEGDGGLFGEGASAFGDDAGIQFDDNPSPGLAASQTGNGENPFGEFDDGGGKLISNLSSFASSPLLFLLSCSISSPIYDWADVEVLPSKGSGLFHC